MILDPIHYLATLGRKPGALDHAPVFRDWKLPACFADLRAALEGHHGAGAGSRRFVRVLQLLGEHPLTRVQPGRSRPAGASTSTAPRPSSSGRGRSPRSRPRRAAGAPTPPEPSAIAPGPRAAARPEPVRPAPERPRRRGPGQRVLRLTRSPIDSL